MTTTTTDSPASSAAGEAIVAYAGTYYRVTRYIFSAVMLAMGAWFADMQPGDIYSPPDLISSEEALRRGRALIDGKGGRDPVLLLCAGMAANTLDVPARKMHQAMAAEYRRRAVADGDLTYAMPVGSSDASYMMADHL